MLPCYTVCSHHRFKSSMLESLRDHLFNKLMKLAQTNRCVSDGIHKRTAAFVYNYLKSMTHSLTTLLWTECTTLLGNHTENETWPAHKCYWSNILPVHSHSSIRSICFRRTVCLSIYEQDKGIVAEQTIFTRLTNNRQLLDNQFPCRLSKEKLWMFLCPILLILLCSLQSVGKMKPESTLWDREASTLFRFHVFCQLGFSFKVFFSQILLAPPKLWRDRPYIGSHYVRVDN